jgi:hypothetical protein
MLHNARCDEPLVKMLNVKRNFEKSLMMAQEKRRNTQD